MTRTTLQITTVNANSLGTLSKYLVDCSSGAVIAQEHHARSDKLSEVQGDAQDSGWRDARCPALLTAAGGAEGGVAVLAKTDIAVTQAPLLADGIIVPGRAVAAHVHAALTGGFVA
eukprot:849017-Pyramimonas_sp.AAC.1